jgi:flagellar hook protein FlgE
MNNSANNIANANTDGFIPQNTVIKESGKDSTEAITSRAADNKSEKSQTNLTKEITDQISIEKVTQANVTAIRTQDDMLGSLLDIKA